MTQRPKPTEWCVSDRPVGYDAAVAAMEARVEAIAACRASELVWLLEHEALYTSGTSAREADLIEPARLPVFRSGRGGQYTYHGPGQRVVYVMLDLKARGGDLRRLVHDLEGWIIDTLAAFNVKGERREGRVGVWIRRPEKGEGREDKIAALGLRVRRGVTFHGLSINVDPDLAHYAGIVPCGISGHGVTSLSDLGRVIAMAEADMALRAAFERRFGATVAANAPA